MNNIKNILITILIFLLLLTGSFFAGYKYRKCPQLVPVTTVIIDTIPPLIIHDTTVMKRVIKIPEYLKDESEINRLIKERDSIARILLIKDVQSLLVFDKVWQPTKDTIHIEVNDFKRTLDSLRIGFYPRDIQIVTKVIELPCPEQAWYNTIYGRVGIDILAVFLSYELGRASK
jgi:hypothetical protein